MTTVQEIHNEFYSAEERLLLEAMNLIANLQVAKANKAERYVKLGFGSCKPVSDALDLANKQLKSAELKETIWYFRQHYPHNKFITEPEVKRICEKYGLLLGDATNYVGDIPEKNLVEIEQFKLRKEDYLEKQLSYGFSSWVWERPIGAAGESGFLGIIPSISRKVGLSREFSRIWDTQLPNYIAGFDPAKKEKKEPEKERPAFKICAPKQDFNTAGFVVRDGYQLVYDPVVLQPVKGGNFLIVSAWGDEASDELVINDKMN